MAKVRSARRSNTAILVGQLALSLMQTTFTFYYIRVYLNVFQLNEWWFNVAQFLFAIWNAVNDPIFGYLQDMGGSWMKKRYNIFIFIGPLMCASFMMLWIPWRRSDGTSPPWVEGLHLIVALFLYDAAFSCVGVAFFALYADSTRDHGRRVKAIKYIQLASLASVNIIVVIEKLSHSLDNFFAFQVICGVVAVVSLFCFYVTGRLSATTKLHKHQKEEALLESNETEEEDGGKGRHSVASAQTWENAIHLTKQLLTFGDFMRVVMANFLHICRSTAQLNFAAIATEILIPQSVLAKGSWQMSAFFGVCTLLPQLLLIFNEQLLLRRGAYRILVWSLFLSMASSTLYLFSTISPYVIMLFMLIDSIAIHSVSPLFTTLLAEVIEEDTSRHSRKVPLSSLTFSLNALITKPANSLAPVVVVFFLNRHGYELYQTSQIKSPELELCMKRIAFALPLILAMLELVVVKRYTLKAKNVLAQATIAVG